MPACRFAAVCLALVLPLVLLAPAAHAAEIVLERSAVNKLVARALYKDQGRYYLQRGACRAYLEQPDVSLADGRVRIRTRLNAFLGQPVGDKCSGQAVDSWVTVSAEPVAAGQVARLQKLRIEKVSDPMLQLMLDAGLGGSLPGAVDLDVSQAVQDMLRSAGGDIVATVERLDIASVTVADERLQVRFDFRLSGR